MESLQKVRLVLVFQVVLYLLASCVHRGWLFPDHAHVPAAVAESVIGTVLAIGLFGSGLRRWRAIALAVEAFALVGTLVGATMIAIGVGPQTPADVVVHAVMLASLVFGLITAIRAGR